jgi:hypothetical protein
LIHVDPGAVEVLRFLATSLSGPWKRSITFLGIASMIKNNKTIFDTGSKLPCDSNSLDLGIVSIG